VRGGKVIEGAAVAIIRARRGSGGGGSRPAVDGEEVDLSHGLSTGRAARVGGGLGVHRMYDWQRLGHA
jgi:hypothetical protein